MILGIGTDIMRIDRLRPECLREGDPFFNRAFSAGERAAGLAQADPQRYFASRFAGKEAVFKAFRGSSENVEFSEIEIWNDENGAPGVTLYQRMKERAEKLGVGSVHISLSYEKEYVAAFAVVESRQGAKNQ